MRTRKNGTTVGSQVRIELGRMEFGIELGGTKFGIDLGTVVRFETAGRELASTLNCCTPFCTVLYCTVPYRMNMNIPLNSMAHTCCMQNLFPIVYK